MVSVNLHRALRNRHKWTRMTVVEDEISYRMKAFSRIRPEKKNQDPPLERMMTYLLELYEH